MKATTLQRFVTTREDAHRAAVDLYAQAQALIADGKRVRMLAEEDDDPKTLRQMRFIHGPVLNQIAEQVVVDGRRYTVDTWKLFFKNLILEREPRFEMVRLPGWKRATPQRQRWSLRELGIKRCSLFIDEVIAHAATEFGVQFVFDIDEREAVRYRAPARKTEQPVQQPEEATA